jgi:hypothetical protein
MASESRRRPLLAPGNEEEWARINKEKLEEEAAFVYRAEADLSHALGVFDGLYEAGYLDRLRSEERA